MSNVTAAEILFTLIDVAASFGLQLELSTAVLHLVLQIHQFSFHLTDGVFQLGALLLFIGYDVPEILEVIQSGAFVGKRCPQHSGTTHLSSLLWLLASNKWFLSL